MGTHFSSCLQGERSVRLELERHALEVLFDELVSLRRPVPDAGAATSRTSWMDEMSQRCADWQRGAWLHSPLSWISRHPSTLSATFTASSTTSSRYLMS